MDKHNATLKQLLDTLSENNGSADWNMYKNKNRKIVVKICFDELLDQINNTSDIKLNTDESFGTKFKIVSDNQNKRNFLRGNSYVKKRKLSQSPETLRNTSVSESDPGNTTESFLTRCLSTESLNHVPYMEISNNGSTSLIQSSPEVSRLCPMSQNAKCEGSKDAEGAQSVDRDQVVSFLTSDNSDSVYLDIDCPSTHEIDMPNVSQCYVPTPFDSDSESNYNENADYMDLWPNFRKPCTKSGCDYRPENMPDFDENTQLGFRPDGSHGLYYLCDLCGRKFCDDCVWVRRRHLHHMKYVQRHTSKGPRGHVDIDRLLDGNF